MLKIGPNFLDQRKRKRQNFGDWFISPIHPITKNFEYWHYSWGKNPVAEKISQHIINLPTHTKINEDYVDRIAEFLRKNRDNIYGNYEEIS